MQTSDKHRFRIAIKQLNLYAALISVTLVNPVYHKKYMHVVFDGVISFITVLITKK